MKRCGIAVIHGAYCAAFGNIIERADNAVGTLIIYDCKCVADDRRITERKGKRGVIERYRARNGGLVVLRANRGTV